jgi:hypothetical protein
MQMEEGKKEIIRMKERKRECNGSVRRKRRWIQRKKRTMRKKKQSDEGSRGRRV